MAKSKLRGLTWLLGGLIALTMLFDLGFRLDYTNGTSMSPTLHDGQILVVARQRTVDALHLGYHRKDIVVIKNERDLPGAAPGTLLVKRLIGMPGDLVGISRRVVYINAEPLSEPYVYYHMNNLKYPYDAVPNGGAQFSSAHFLHSNFLTKNSYFVLGDNRPSSADSRWFGPIKKHQLQGKVLWATPLNYHFWPSRLLGELIAYFPVMGMLLIVGLNWLRYLRSQRVARDMFHVKR
ncbi:signal peptidase I [Lacticaseibacillus yichunensis]|uniref:Signal peptidase I n=1 Tax=Lacticaseibacillus yichunensis TaxID=2486015 RepID=A0ABW4CU33_9LACO|nr:signal peptidase I [Lacticaseibacillus yichunensis]